MDVCFDTNHRLFLFRVVLQNNQPRRKSRQRNSFQRSRNGEFLLHHKFQPTFHSPKFPAEKAKAGRILCIVDGKDFVLEHKPSLRLFDLFPAKRSSNRFPCCFVSLLVFLEQNRPIFGFSWHSLFPSAWPT